MKKNLESELVLNKHGRLYHINTQENSLAKDIILVGDPGRVDMVASFFSKVTHSSSNREIFSKTGLYKGKEISVISTGMGVDNIDIVLTEIDAAFNMDLETKQEKEDKTSLNLIRLGTSGAMHKEIPTGSFLASQYSVGLDGIMYFYDLPKDVINKEASESFIRYMDWGKDLPKPYFVEASNHLLEKIAFDMEKGITATSPGFYGPQGREIRLPLAYPEINSILPKFLYNNVRMMNYEMETSAIYAIAKSLNHSALTVCLVIANRESGEFLNDYSNEMRNLIEVVLERIIK